MVKIGQAQLFLLNFYRKLLTLNRIINLCQSGFRVSSVRYIIADDSIHSKIRAVKALIDVKICDKRMLCRQLSRSKIFHVIGFVQFSAVNKLFRSSAFIVVPLCFLLLLVITDLHFVYFGGVLCLGTYNNVRHVHTVHTSHRQAQHID